MFDPPKLAVSLAGLSRGGDSPWVGRPKKTLEWVAHTAHTAGVRRVVLDATRPEFRPRELGPGERRDLAGVLRRRELEFAGIDLFLPTQDLLNTETLDRAVGAITGAIGLAADLAGPDASGRVVSVVLPEAMLSDAVRTIADEAARHGVRLANHAWPDAEHDSPNSILTGIDPVSVIESGQSPGKAAARAGDRLCAARLSDRNQTGRCVVESSGGELDVLGYGGALATVGIDTVTIDLRGLGEPADAIEHAAAAWARVFTLPG